MDRPARGAPLVAPPPPNRLPLAVAPISIAFVLLVVLAISVGIIASAR